MGKEKQKDKKVKEPVRKDKEVIDKKVFSTKIIDDVFTDEIAMVKPKFEVDLSAYVERLWEANREVYKFLKSAENLEDARDKMFTYLEKSERAIFDVDNDLHILEKANLRECIRALKSIIGPVNEFRTGVSALDILMKLAKSKDNRIETEVSVGFVMEFINLFRGVKGESKVYHETDTIKKGIPDFLSLKGKEAAEARTEILDDIGSTLRKYFMKYPSGLDERVKGFREENKKRILKYFGAKEEDWNDYIWHIKHVIKDAKPLLDLIELTIEQQEAVKKAVEHRIPFGITPYYLSLMDTNLSIGYDHAVRAHVIPPPEYVDTMVGNRDNRSMAFDFMGEHDTSPAELITRRYPGIAIFKPYNTCAQICVYCQRNWEIDEVLDPKAMSKKEVIDKAVEWFKAHPSVGDVLITGGDPFVMKDEPMKSILEAVANIDHIYRIRIGTRTPVVLPMRWTDEFVKMLSQYHVPGKRELAIVTHFVHSYEITPEAMEAVQKIRKVGVGVYNQEVFTVENSRRFETAKLRRDLRSIGVDPYYTFNMKGKGETRKYMVPIARILQERKEEARLLPGLDRTDEPVFNVPKLGKNHLRAWQDHRLVMIRQDGSRVYEFHPWEKNIKAVPPYNYVDVPIYDYLEELAARGENIRDYRTIWFYY